MMTTEFLQDIQPSSPKNTIYLIDVSGSTESPFLDTPKGVASLTTIYKKMFQIVEAQKMNVDDKADVMFWSSTNLLLKQLNLAEITMNKELHRWEHRFGGTCLVPALNTLSLELNNTKYDKIEIITDGQIGDNEDSVIRALKQIVTSNENIIINIRTVSNENVNYTQNLTNVANKLYNIIMGSGNAKLVEKYILYSPNNQDGFVNLFNAKLLDGQIQFNDKFFDQNDLTKFIVFLQELSKKIISQNDEMAFVSLTKTLLTTINAITKNKPPIIKKHVIKMFCNALTSISQPDYVETALNQLANTLMNDVTANEITFQNYIANRNKLFEKTQLNLMDDFANSFKSNVFQKLMFFTVVENNDVLQILTTNLSTNSSFTTTIQYGFDKYHNSSIQIDDHIYPVLPLNFVRTKQVEQSVRQWIRKVYGQRYGINSDDELLMYVFLTDAMRIINCSQTPEPIIKSLRLSMHTMLNRNRFNANIREIVFLKEGNPPTSLMGSVSGATEMLRKSASLFNLAVSPYGLWNQILLALGDEELMLAQAPFCEQSKNKISPFTTVTMTVLSDFKEEYEYVCVYSLEATEETGGYIIDAHDYNNFCCSPKFVLTEPTYHRLLSEGNEFMCPICRLLISTTCLVKIPPKTNNMHSTVDLTEWKQNDVGKQQFETINLSQQLDNNELLLVEGLLHLPMRGLLRLPIDSITFTPKSLSVVGGKVFIHPLNRKSIMVKTNGDVLNHIYSHFPYLKNISFTTENGFCIAGGFCAKVLLGETTTNDIDVFLHKIVDGKTVLNKIHEINDAMMKHDNGYELICVYKTNTNVIDLIFRKDDVIMVKFQMILIAHNSLLQIMNEFDINSCCVLFCDETMSLSERGQNAFRYMMNELNIDWSSPIYSSRLQKYYSRGFAIGVKNELLDYVETECPNPVNYCDDVIFKGIDVNKNRTLDITDEGDGAEQTNFASGVTTQYDSVGRIMGIADKYPESVFVFKLNEIELVENAFLKVGKTVIEKLIDVKELYYLNEKNEQLQVKQINNNKTDKTSNTDDSDEE